MSQREFEHGFLQREFHNRGPVEKSTLLWGWRPWPRDKKIITI